MFQLTCPGKQCVRNDVLSGLTVALALVAALAYEVGRSDGGDRWSMVALFLGIAAGMPISAAHALGAFDILPRSTAAQFAHALTGGFRCGHVVNDG